MAVDLRWSDAEVALVEAHRVGDEPIVPAAVLICRVLSELRHDEPSACLTDLMFHAPIRLTDQAQLHGQGDPERMRFCVAGIREKGSDQPVFMECSGAVAESARWIDSSAASDPGPEMSGDVIDVEAFYEELQRHGNSFLGPLRLVNALRLGDSRLAVSIEAAGEPHGATLDACLHSLLAFCHGLTETPYVIRSIERLEILKPLRGSLRCLGRLRRRLENGFVADMTVTDAAGDPLAGFHGIHYAAYVPARGTLVVAGNFVLDPLQEAYDTLGRALGLRARLAPYDQVHQTLLDPTSPALDASTAELLLFVDLSRWDDVAPLRRGEPYREALAAGGSTTLLPNKLEVFGANKYETEYLYEEIFDHRTYLRGGIGLEPGDTVLDIGANIGMFSLHVLDLRPDARVIAFEPSPITAALARANLEGRGDVRVLQLGVSDAAGVSRFTHYDASTVFSGFHADERADRRAIRQVIDNRLAAAPDVQDREEYVSDLAANRLAGRQFEVRLTSVSDVIDEHALAAIGLLKIDAEKSEDAILRGIRREHWPRIRQVALEIHDPGMTRVPQIRRFLEEQGYSVSVFEERELRNAGLYSMSAVRACRKPMPGSGANFRGLHERLDELHEAIQSFRARSHSHVTVLFTSSHPGSRISSHVARQYRHVVHAFRRKAASIANLSVASPSDIERWYRASAAHTPLPGVEDAGVPFGTDWYAAASLWALRQHVARLAGKKKVLVVDCDNTLWRGLCAEDGPLGVQIGPAFRRWQRFLADQRRAGTILCLCSRNVPGDVLAVFEQHADMVLSLDDIALAKIGWQPKSALVAEIAADLNLATDSIVFVDDNEAECAEVSLAHPDVTCLRFPHSSDEIERFCRHTWIFDLFKPDGASLDRTRHYQEEWRRKALRKSHYSLAEFIEGLQLEVQLQRLSPEHFDRISEMAQRTNQFNLHARIRDRAGMAALLSDPQIRGWIVHVRDRFGDYGVTGAIYGKVHGGVFDVENFLLSCRVLGRGVERCVAARLAEELASIGADRCRLTALETERNVPAMRFFRALADTREDVQSIVVAAWGLRSAPLDVTETPLEQAAPAVRAKPSASASRGGQPWSGSRNIAWLEWIRSISGSAESIAEAVWGPRATPGSESTVGETVTERRVAALWHEVLGAPPAGRECDFFASGGSSIQLVRLVSAMKREFSVPLRLSEVHRRGTLASLAALIDSRVPLAQGDGDALPSRSQPVLAPTQEGLWFIQNLDSSSTTYNVPLAVCVHRALEPNSLSHRLQALAQKHRILTSRYLLEGTRTHVLIDAAARIPLTTVEGSSWSAQELVEYCSIQARRPVDLRNGPIVSAFLVRWSQGRSVVLLVTHHLVADLKSLEVILSELLQTSVAEERCAPPQGDFWHFADWHRRWLDGENGKVLEHFWRTELCSPPPVPLIEYERSKQPPAGPFFEVITSYVGSHALGRLRLLARDAGTSLFRVLLSASASFAGSYFRKSDFIIGTPVSLRDNGPYLSELGNFVNLLPLRLRHRNRFADMHAIVGETFERCLAHKELPFHRMTQLVGRRPARLPLVQMVFSFHESEGAVPIGEIVHHGRLSREFCLDSTPCQILGLRQQVGHVDVAVETFECGSGLGINLKYATHCLTAGAAQKLIDGFTALLTALAENPG